MATTEKIRRDIEKVREKITEQQKRLRALEAQLAEEENLEIVRMVKAVHMDNKELTAFLRAYASGMISLPEGMMEMEAAADPDMMEGADDEEEQQGRARRQHFRENLFEAGHLECFCRLPKVRKNIEFPPRLSEKSLPLHGLIPGSGRLYSGGETIALYSANLFST